MHSATSSEGSRLVTIAVPCAQMRVAIETYSRANGTKHCVFQEACSAGHQASSKARGKVYSCHSLVVDSTFEQSENVTIIRGVRAAALGLWSVGSTPR